MKCHVCGAGMKNLITDLPFKVSNRTILVMKDLPVLQCRSCGEYLLDDPVMERVESVIEKVDAVAELEVIKYAA